jgi:hypothetical protein
MLVATQPPTPYIAFRRGIEAVGGDGAADALRYWVATKSRTIAQRKLRGL